MSLVNCYIDSHGCTVCPDIPPTPGTPGGLVYTVVLGWNAGANSVQELDGDVLLTFTMPLAVLGVVCGFRHGRLGVGIPEMNTHGFVFQRGVDSLSLYGIVENGTTVLSSVARSPDLDETFYIQRRNGVVTYYVDDVVPAYTSSVPSSGPLIVGGCLYASGDDIG